MTDTDGEAENLPQDTETEVRAFILTCDNIKYLPNSRQFLSQTIKKVYGNIVQYRLVFRTLIPSNFYNLFSYRKYLNYEAFWVFSFEIHTGCVYSISFLLQDISYSTQYIRGAKKPSNTGELP